MDKPIGFGRKKRLGDLLVEAGVVTQDQLTQALNVQKTEKKGQRLGVVLMDLGFTDEKHIMKALCSQLKLQPVDLSNIRIPEEITKLTEEAVLRKHNLIPFQFHEKNPNVIKVAMSDPLDIRAMDDISIITGLQIERYVATPSDIAAAIDRYYGNAEALRVAEQYTREREEQNKAKNVEAVDESSVQQAPIVKLLGQIIEQAVHKRASDIHIEPMENQVRIRFRVDGVLHEAMRHDISLHAALIARIKIVSGLDISEKRRPQDGRATSIVDRQEYDIRVSILPTVYGEKVVMRLAQKKALTMDKRELGFPDDELAKFDKILSHPNGMILVTGPTGSGKSTTLYTALNELNGEGVNIITVEDPVEANVTGINQVQVNEKAGLTFSSALRSILRQDPDIIMIGEIRDQETAEIAVKASITGHLVVSTLHTNSSANTITRLADMGVENYLIADSVVGVIAQRLVRRVCPTCGVVHEASPADAKTLGFKDLNRKIMLRYPGHKECVRCGGTGYYGRIGIYEIMPITADLRQAITRGESADQLEAIALRHGMKTLRMSAVEYALKGITTVEEVRRVAFEDEDDD
jgi:type IV pilus assembly protein PilB|uniref:GspE/PulE family protein n=1 Tax=Agathobacter sp. TaxID=2021311 RepID=UPI004027F3CB